MTYVPESIRGQRLNDGEIEILAAVSYGLTDRAIATKLYMGESTVKTHLRRMAMKLGSQNRAHMVRVGFEVGYLRLPVAVLHRNARREIRDMAVPR